MNELLPRPKERLWVDDEQAFDARQRATNDPVLIAAAKSFREDGFLHIKRAAPQRVVDAARAAYDDWCLEQLPESLSVRGDGRNPRVVNLHGDKIEFKKLFTESPEALRILDYLFGYKTGVYTSLTFQYGTEQPLHRDTPVFRTEPEEFYFGAWFALEDADEENGCLVALKGAHRDGRVDPFKFAADMGYKPGEVDAGASDIWAAYQEAVIAKCREEGYEPVLIPAEKGDVVIWHPQLPHGGSPVKDGTRTRYSTVFHVVPESVPVYQGDVFFNPEAKPARKSKFNYEHFDGRQFMASPANIGTN